MKRSLILFMLLCMVSSVSIAQIGPTVKIRKVITDALVLDGATIRSLPFYDVTNHGASGDGITDSRAVIQSAITALEGTGKTIYLPEGTFILKSRTITSDGTDLPHVFLYSPIGGFNLVGAGKGLTTIKIENAGLPLYVGNKTTGALGQAVDISGITFEYTGGYKAGPDSAVNGLVLRVNRASIHDCAFSNFLVGIYVLPNSYDCVIDKNDFLWTNGKASIAYHTNWYGLRPTDWPQVGIQNWGVRTRITNNFADCLIDSNFTHAIGSPPDTICRASDGFSWGVGGGTTITGNTVMRNQYEGIYVAPALYTDETGEKTVVSGNVIDGTQRQNIGGGNVEVPCPGMGGWGIRADCDNVTITANPIRGQGWGIFLAETSILPGQRHTFTIANNPITDVVFGGVYVGKRTGGSIESNVIKSIDPDSAQKAWLKYPNAFIGGIVLGGIGTQPDSGVTITGNTIYATKSGWYFATPTITAIIGDTTFELSSVAGIVKGLYVRFGYESGGSLGTTNRIDSVWSNNVHFPTAYSGASPGDTLFIAQGTIDTYSAGAGIALEFRSEFNHVFGNTIFNALTPVTYYPEWDGVKWMTSNMIYGNMAVGCIAPSPVIVMDSVVRARHFESDSLTARYVSFSPYSVVSVGADTNGGVIEHRAIAGWNDILAVYRSGDYKWALQDDGGRANFTGDATVQGTFLAGNGVSLRFGFAAFAASTRVAVYLPGTEDTDVFVVNWQPTTELATLPGGKVWSFTKTDSLILLCDSVCSTQAAYEGPR